MKFFSIIFSCFLLFACAKERIAGEQDETQKLSPYFTASTTPIHILTGSNEIEECFYKNNFVKLIAYDPLISEYKWYRMNGNNHIFMGSDSVLITSLDGEYRLDMKLNWGINNNIDSTIFVNLDYCTTLVDVPSSFTPDGDNQFDTWFPIFIGVSDFYVRITNENGSVVFESETEQKHFNGKFNNTNLPSGTYHYYISGIYRTGYVFEKQGNLELVR